MNPEDEEFETYIDPNTISTLINMLKKTQDYTTSGNLWKYVIEEENREEVNFKGLDEVITELSVEEFIEAIKQSGVWSVRGFKQEDLDAILMLNLDPLIMKLFLTFSLGELGQERVLNYLNDENPDNVW